MAKYKNTDIRTGYKEGEIVELTDEQLAETPFNVKLQKIDVIDEKESIGKAKEAAEKEALKNMLADKGLSPNRISAVVGKYSSKAELKKNLKKAKIDPLTDEFLADLDGDGDFDKDDLAIAGKVLAKGRKR